MESKADIHCTRGTSYICKEHSFVWPRMLLKFYKCHIGAWVKTCFFILEFMLTLTSPLCYDKNKSLITTISPRHHLSFNRYLDWSLNRYSGDPHDYTFIITFFVTCFILPLAVIIMCYSKMLCKLRKVSLVLLLEKSAVSDTLPWIKLHAITHLKYFSELYAI